MEQLNVHDLCECKAMGKWKYIKGIYTCIKCGKPKYLPGAPKDLIYGTVKFEDERDYH